MTGVQTCALPICCHAAKCNMLNKWLKTHTKSILVTHTFTFTTIHLKDDLFTHICINISHTRTTTYAHMQMRNPPQKSGKIKCCHLANMEYFLSLLLFRMGPTSTATWRISRSTYADALNSIEFCSVIISGLFCQPSWNL